MAIKAIMARDNLGVENGKLILQDFGSVSESVRNTKINRRFDINDLLVIIDEDKDKYYLIPINKKSEFIRLSTGSIDYESDISDYNIDHYEVDGDIVEYSDTRKIRLPIKRDDDDSIRRRRDTDDYVFPESNTAALELLESYSNLMIADDPSTKRQFQTYVSQLRDGKLTEKSMAALMSMIGVKKFTGFYIEHTGHTFLPKHSEKALNRDTRERREERKDERRRGDVRR